MSTFTDRTKKWIEELIIGMNLCPFAKRPYFDGRVRFTECPDEGIARTLEYLAAEFQFLDNHKEIETTIFIIPDGLQDFDVFLDVLGLAQDLIQSMNYEGVYQLAHFHPDYLFEELPPEDASHFTNRSPYPIFHILREEGLEKAIKEYDGDIHQIPIDNIRKAQILGRKKLESLL